MKKRIERDYFTLFLWHSRRMVSEKSSWKRGLREEVRRDRSSQVQFRFQRKAHEKEDWEFNTSHVSLEGIAAPVSEKSSWKRGLRGMEVIERVLANTPESLFQRKAHEKEDWELEDFAGCLRKVYLYVSEKSSWKRGLREFVDLVNVTTNCLLFQRKAHEKEDWELVFSGTLHKSRIA